MGIARQFEVMARCRGCGCHGPHRVKEYHNGDERWTCLSCGYDDYL